MPRLSKIGAAALAAFGWTTGASAVTASYLVVAGGAGGGYFGGGGGAGGLLTGTSTLNPTLSYTITVGAGGAGAASNAARGSNGSDSVFNAVTSTGGGGGGSDGFSPYTGAAGGSGGGGSYKSSSAGGAGTSGQGFAGGSGIEAGPNYTSGGGGGAGAVGGNGSAGGAGGSGGVGLTSSITGTSTYYAGGGGGDSQVNSSVAPGGLGGGGAGARSGVRPVAGTANLGGGGGGGGSSTFAGAQGGSGIVIISYAGAQQFSGGVVTSSGGNTIHTFTTSGTLGPVTPLSANYLVVAGGGGASWGGGGAGGLLSGSSLTIDPYSIYIVTVGSGGAAGAGGSTTGTNGGNSAFSLVSTNAIGGGGGGSNAGSPNSGGSGGGNSNNNGSAGAGTSGQGNAGGTNVNSGAGGGGAGAAAQTGLNNLNGGPGGVGLTASISGTSTYYAGGGGGAPRDGNANNGTGGLGGGGTAASSSGASGSAGTANTGGGGGGGAYNNAGGWGAAGAGGSGVVIISYAGSTQLMAGGVVTIAGGNVIHTFNSSGFLSPLTLLTRSLRFRSSASAYLNRTPTVAGNRRTWTYSAWVKLGSLSTTLNLMYAYSADSDSGLCQLSYQSNQLRIQGYSASFVMASTAVYRDPAAWYHVVYSVDTTQATAANRVRVYVNGVEITAWATNTPPPQNTDTAINNSVAHNIGRNTRNSNDYLDGYMTEINLIDGQALAPTAFGTFNSYGVWQPITYGGSYGTNGFRLPFTNNASTTTLGYDFSPQGNNWTTNNISITAGSTYDSMTDVPTLTSATAANYAVLNPLYPSSIPVGGNLNVVGDSNSRTVAGTMSSPIGKYYAEGTFTSGFATNGWFFVWDTSTPYVPGNVPATTGQTGAYYAGITGNIVKAITGTTTTIGTYSTWTNNDIIGMAFDSDAGTVSFYKNNTLQVTITDSAFIGRPLTFGIYYYAGSASMNFGQRPFTYTPPSGFVALNTFNL